MNTTANQFNSEGAVLVKDVVTPEMARFMTQALMLNQSINGDAAGDSQCPNSKSPMYSSLIFDTLLEKAWPYVEGIVGEPLWPTYSYARLYRKGDILENHIDRESCEVSLTLQLGRSHHYAWPIYMGKKRYDLAEGEGVIYSGCEIPHWRNECDPPDETYYSGQVFLHFVRQNGPYHEWAGDKRYTYNPFLRFRTEAMENK